MGSTQKKGGSGRCCAMKCQLPAGKTFPFSSWQSYCPWKEHLGSIMAGRRGYKLEGTAGEHELLRHFPGAIRHPKTDVLQSVRRAMAVFAGFPNWSGSNPLTTCRGRGDEQRGAVLGGGKERWRKTWSVFGGKCSTSEESHSSEGRVSWRTSTLASGHVLAKKDSHRRATYVYIRETLHDIQRPSGKSHLIQHQEKQDFRSTMGSMGVCERCYFSLCSGLTNILTLNILTLTPRHSCGLIFCTDLCPWLTLVS